MVLKSCSLCGNICIFRFHVVTINELWLVEIRMVMLTNAFSTLQQIHVFAHWDDPSRKWKLTQDGAIWWRTNGSHTRRRQSTRGAGQSTRQWKRIIDSKFVFIWLTCIACVDVWCFYRPFSFNFTEGHVPFRLVEEKWRDSWCVKFCACAISQQYFGCSHHLPVCHAGRWTLQYAGTNYLLVPSVTLLLVDQSFDRLVEMCMWYPDLITTTLYWMFTITASAVHQAGISRHLVSIPHV